MKRISIALFILVCFNVYAAHSLELELIEGVGNMAYNPDNKTALSADELNPGTFTPLYFPLIQARVSGEINGIGFSFGFKRDPILRNSLFANISIEQEYFTMEGGPFFGLFNSGKLPVNPGVNGNLRLMIPGIVFIEAGGSSTLAAIPMEKEGNYSQITADLKAGAWVPHVICSLNMSMRNNTLRDTTTILIEDELLRYFFRADVFTKNYSYTVKVDLGFQNLKRSYSSLDIVGTDIVKTTQTDEFKSLFMGLEGIFAINPGLKLILGAEMPIYSWSVRPMKDSPKKTMFFEARAGIVIALPAGKSQEKL